MNEAVLIPATLALVEAIKKAGLPKKYAPLASIACAVLITGIFYNFKSGFLLEGLIVGLSASGLYSQAKTTLENFKNKEER